MFLDFFKKLAGTPEEFNKPKLSPNGCLMGNTSGKNTTETITEILNKTTRK